MADLLHDFWRSDICLIRTIALRFDVTDVQDSSDETEDLEFLLWREADSCQSGLQQYGEVSIICPGLSDRVALIMRTDPEMSPLQ